MIDKDSYEAGYDKGYADGYSIGLNDGELQSEKYIRLELLKEVASVLEFYSGAHHDVKVSKAAEEGGTIVIDDGELARNLLKKLKGKL